ncbi:metallophosphatase domain-containing protein [Gramella sp. KN1008]|uniref:metallophosphatase domain-containing protein n=1 Tax=Gramella sp. KN1008 TaxID=2529298 RepID=UPI001038DA71|nr:metallophosphatase domain-containing protein [Gramella sp. KN1008]TBW30136.1 metallophosphoesterase [Gramella sp. KN1008]
MRLVCLADTHNQHRDIAIPEGDILIHAGDCTDGGTRNETSDFLAWFSEQPHQHKILVPGNHDFYFQKAGNLIDIPENIHLLIDNGREIEGLQFWGSPVCPGNGNWAFIRERGTHIKKHWDLIPDTTDILITHTPPYGILDQIGSGAHIGCEELAKTLELVQPKYHFFGHIHQASGRLQRSGTSYFNLSILDERFRIMHSPAVLDL